MSLVILGAVQMMEMYDLIWAPSYTIIATVSAKTPRAARRKAPYPYHKYLGEIIAEKKKPGDA